MMKFSLIQRSWICKIIALLSGSIGTLSFSPYDIWITAILSLSGLLFITLNRTAKQASLLGFFWGLGLFGSGMNWIYVGIANCGGIPIFINIFLVMLLSAYLSIYSSLFAGLLVYFCPETCWRRLSIAAPVLWQITEFLRGWVLTGFPWLQFGYSELSGPIRGLAPVMGVDSITFLLMSISGLLVHSIHNRCAISAVVAAALLFSSWTLSKWDWFTLLPEKAVNIAIIQGNIPQSLKWSSKALSKTLKTYLHETLACIGKATIIIWPESAIPDYEFRQGTFLSMLDKYMRADNSSLITGILDACSTPQGFKIYNSVIVLGETEPYTYPAKNRYNKHHLVPFGEFIPLQNLLLPLGLLFNLPTSTFSQGYHTQPQLKFKEYRLTTSICYEIIFGKQLRDNFKPDTQFIVNLSNDSWFGHSIGPWQHFQMARMRALELGRPVIRGSNNGITAVINANGEIISKIPQFTRQVLKVNVTPTTGVTPYSRFGATPLWSITFLLGGWILLYRLRLR